ncbi:ketopantoate reductase family protein [Streptomyces sp. NPDC050560]|uniref:ketopantoate reductase family protein n=1 Tax=Streptomyces sp. NPDC050560 TaxID=3365630 RepID=UPI00378B3FCB
MTNETWTVAVLGPGGVGGLLGGLLGRGGHRVVCVAGEGTAGALRERGLTVRSGVFGEFRVPVETRTVLDEPVDAVFVTTKENHLREALERVPADVLGGGLVVPLLNGFEHVPVLRGRYQDRQVVPGIIRVASARTEPGLIVHTSPFTDIELASATAPADRVAALADVLRGSGVAVTVRAPEDEGAMLWEKLSFLLPLALFTTRYRVPIGVVRAEHRDDLVAVVEETARVGRAAGAAIAPEAVLTLLDAAPAGMGSSMQRDAESGRATELDAIGGALLREAARQGTTVPVTARLVAELGGI